MLLGSDFDRLLYTAPPVHWMHPIAYNCFHVIRLFPNFFSIIKQHCDKLLCVHICFPN